MSPDRWSRLECIFEEALAHCEDRSEFLQRACGGDRDLKRELELLLGHDAEEQMLLDGPAVLCAGAHLSDIRIRLQAEASDRTNGLSRLVHSMGDRHYGPYRLQRPIGSGGMGSVYLAERADGEVQQNVAIKLLHGVDRPEFRRRFLVERQILASLNHPGIAKLLDAGHDGSGQPYLAMEYVDGIPIDAYAESLDLRQKLRLFRQVCEAVSYAHRNLIVHRDLKPSNILIDRDGQPKLLDFGIAKIMDAAQEHEECTVTTLRALTPAYASPEQVRGDLVTTATDIYSLGVLLYKLLTGRLPYDCAHQKADALARTICEAEPQPACISTDLDNILLMALRKEPSRRFASVEQFSDDIDRALSDRPVLARPNTVRYCAVKFMQRNRLALIAASLVLLSVFAGSIISFHQARLAQQRFNDVRKLAHTFVFDLHDEVAKLEGSTKARELMVRTALEYLNNLGANSGGDLALRREIATGYTKIGDAEGNPNGANLGRISEAVASYRKAGAIYEEIAAKDPAFLADLASYDLRYAALVRFIPDLTKARELSESAIQMLERMRAQGKWDPRSAHMYAAAWCTLGDLDEDLGRDHTAWVENTRCRDLASGDLKSGRTVEALNNLAQADERVATCAGALGHFKEALQALDEDESTLGELLSAEPRNPKFHRRRALVDAYRAGVFFSDNHPSLGNPARALPFAIRYLNRAEEMVRSDPRNTAAEFSRAVALFTVSLSLRQIDARSAVHFAQESVRAFDNLIAAGKASDLVTSRRLRALVHLGEAQLSAKDLSGSRRTADAILRAAQPLAHRTDATSLDKMTLIAALILDGKVDGALGERDRAEKLLLQARTEAQSGAKSDELENLIPLANADEALGNFYSRERSSQAAVYYREMADLWRRFPESSEYVDLRKADAHRLLASVQ